MEGPPGEGGPSCFRTAWVQGFPSSIRFASLGCIGVRLMGLKLISTIAGGVLVGLLAACSEEPTSGQTQRLQAQIQELTQQVRQYRAEIQRSNEKIVAMLQAHGLQSDNRPGASLATDPHAGHSAASTPATAGDASAALHRSHETMDREMMSVQMTGDPDRDFLAMMIPHHQGAIDMARIIIESGKKPEVKKFAMDIIAHQKAEIDLMNRWLQAPPQ
jgi:uncharacterized protein (DUF305 family)